MDRLVRMMESQQRASSLAGFELVELAQPRVGQAGLLGDLDFILGSTTRHGSCGKRRRELCTTGTTSAQRFQADREARTSQELRQAAANLLDMPYPLKSCLRANMTVKCSGPINRNRHAHGNDLHSWCIVRWAALSWLGRGGFERRGRLAVGSPWAAASGLATLPVFARRRGRRGSSAGRLTVDPVTSRGRHRWSVSFSAQEDIGSWHRASPHLEQAPDLPRGHPCNQCHVARKEDRRPLGPSNGGGSRQGHNPADKYAQIGADAHKPPAARWAAEAHIIVRYTSWSVCVAFESGPKQTAHKRKLSTIVGSKRRRQRLLEAWAGPVRRQAVWRRRRKPSLQILSRARASDRKNSGSCVVPGWLSAIFIQVCLLWLALFCVDEVCLVLDLEFLLLCLTLLVAVCSW